MLIMRSFFLLLIFFAAGWDYPTPLGAEQPPWQGIHLTEGIGEKELCLNKPGEEETKELQQPSQQVRKIKQLLQEGRQAYREKYWEKATLRYQQAWDQEGLTSFTLADFHYDVLAMMHLSGEKEKRKEKIHQLLESALQRNPSTPTTWFLVGMHALAEHEARRAAAAFLQATTLVTSTPKSTEQETTSSVAQKKEGFSVSEASLYEHLGMVAHELHWQQLAEESLRKAVELEKLNPQYQFNLAIYYLTLTPPARELGRRYYERARELGASLDKGVEELLAR
jgi:tetratricopeptide (TPR) repeat protein